MSYRNLSNFEIAILEKQGCSAEDWSQIKVKPDFLPDQIRNVSFSGEIRLGIYKETIETVPGIFKKAGIYDSNIHSCSIGDEVYISNVNTIVRYEIQDHVVIKNVTTLVVFGESSFGNGTELEIVNEKSNRKLLIYDRLTAQVAYLFVFYRHDKELISCLEEMIKSYVSSRRKSHGVIETGARIINSQTIRNVNIGVHARISGITLLEDGTIVSCKEDPVKVGTGVIASKFIILSGSSVDTAALIEKCFIGQGVQIGKSLSAENSAFFANCEGFHGEALCIFAGPYTVTHHKSTLLIAAFYSFFNAGSGTNQSNHMYKLGPVHQGILERGVKTGSFSYLMWPCRIGAFNVVIGKHSTHIDTSSLPFSYVVDSGGKSLVLPALNLFTVGTLRDSSKWQPRDRRKDKNKLDLISFELFNPYIIGKVMEGRNILRKIDKEVPAEQEVVDYKGVNLRRQKLNQSIRLYEHAIRIFIGNEIIRNLDQMNDGFSTEKILDLFTMKKTTLSDRWTDMAGMISPISAIEELTGSIKSGKVSTIDEIAGSLLKIHNEYQHFSWKWCAKIIGEYYGIEVSKITPDQLVMILNEWKESKLQQTEAILQDARKEFDDKSRIGYGIDGDDKIRDEDFNAARGSFEEDKFIIELKNESLKAESKWQKYISLIQNDRT